MISWLLGDFALSWRAVIEAGDEALGAYDGGRMIFPGLGTWSRVRVELPASVRRASNEDANAGGFRLWEELIEPHDRECAASGGSCDDV